MATYRELLAAHARLEREIRYERVRRIRAAVANMKSIPKRLGMDIAAMNAAINATILDYEMFDEHLNDIEDQLFE